MVMKHHKVQKLHIKCNFCTLKKHLYGKDLLKATDDGDIVITDSNLILEKINKILNKYKK